MAMTTAAVASFFVREDELPDERREQRFEHLVLAELAELRRELAELRGDAQSALDGAPDRGPQDASGATRTLECRRPEKRRRHASSAVRVRSRWCIRSSS